MYQYQTEIAVDTESNSEISALNELASKFQIVPQLIGRKYYGGNTVFMLHSAQQVNIRNFIIEICGKDQQSF